MRDKLELIETVLQDNSGAVDRNIVSLDIILTQLARFFRTTFSSTSSDKKGREFTEPLDAALRISITLMEMIDKGTVGLDDKLAVEWRGIYEKFLGPYREYTDRLDA